MELDDLQRRILHRQELERLESMPPKSYNPSEGMSPEEMNRYIQFLFEQIQQKDAQHKELLEQIAGIKSELKQANSEQKRLNALVLSLTTQLHESQQANAEQSRIIADLQSSARVSKKHRFGSPSQRDSSESQQAESDPCQNICENLIITK